MTEMTTISTLLQDVTKLPSLPSVAMKIVEEVKKDMSSIGDLVDIMSVDPALTTKILRVANSSFYAPPYKVDSVDKAVNIIGLEALKNIALSFVIVEGLKRKSIDEFNHELFWKRSITAAVSAEMISSKLRSTAGDVFVTPLLMDIGVYVMYLSRPDDYLKVLDRKKVSEMTTDEAEREVFGFDHMEAGSEVLKYWGIPEEIYMPIAYHHKVEDCPSEYLEMADVLMLADLTSSIYHGNKSAKKFGILGRILKDKMGISDVDVDGFNDSVAEKTVEILTTFEIDPGDMKPYSQLLGEANEELGKLNLSYEQLIMELKQARDMAEKRAIEALEAKNKLKELVVKDGLTNLYNHRHFQDFHDRELSRVERYSHVLSLKMIDIDFFKLINDTHGHPQGDKVLCAIANILEKSVRKPDIVARYGGEEFAVVLPETDIKGAVSLADRLRKKVEAHEFKIGNDIVTVTISLGVTTYDSGRGIKSKDEVIEAADKALYNSKQTGRNKLSIIS